MTVLSAVLDTMPHGRGLADRVWERRHRGLVLLLTAQCAVLGAAELLVGEGLIHTVVDLLPILLTIVAARSRALSTTARSTACALGLVICSAVLVHLASGYIEAHFHFFVMVALLSLYQAWVPFAVAVGFVALHHGVLGVVFPSAVYNHVAAIQNPWLYSGIHSVLLLAACVACLISWRLNEHQALHDSLTGLANRTLLAERLTLVSRPDQPPFAALFLDLDDFKSVNDNRSHAVGDQLLVDVAHRLRDQVRQGDTVARVGGDEFAILLHSIEDPAAAIEVANRILSDLRRPFEIDGHHIGIGASIGIALHDHGDADTESIMNRADMAMYVAKRHGKGRFEVFDDDAHAAVIDRLALQADMGEALHRGQFFLHYQPILDMETGDVLGVESLVRWAHPTRGLIPPDRFIPLAEESGAIIPLGAWVLEEACRQMAAWNASRERPLYLSVNVSPRQLRADVATTVRHALDLSGMDPRWLVLEVTEAALVGDASADVDPLHEIRSLGVRIAVDDFGTGYSSLNYLRRLPVDVVKIDRSFVQHLTAGSEDEALVDAIVRLCRALGLAVIAEGIETCSEADVLRELGVSAGQGFLFARPALPDDLDELLRANSASLAR